jgi:hydrogenase large subunit
MPVTFNIDPVSRIEGHLKVNVTVATALDPSPGTVSYVECQSKLFRGFENILKRRDPRDAPVICQRI